MVVEDRFLTMGEARQKIGVTHPTLRQMIKRLSIRTYSWMVDSRAILIRTEDVDRMIEARRSPNRVVQTEPRKDD